MVFFKNINVSNSHQLHFFLEWANMRVLKSCEVLTLEIQLLTSMRQKPTLTTLAFSYLINPEKSSFTLTLLNLKIILFRVCWNYLLEAAQNLPGSSNSWQKKPKTKPKTEPDKSQKSCAFPTDLPLPIYWHNAFVQ